MRRYRNLAYVIQIMIAISIMMSLALPWHREWGAGIDILNSAFHQENAFLSFYWADGAALHFSTLWGLWVLPLATIGVMVRAAGGLVVDGAEGNRQIWVLLVFMGVAMVWVYASFSDGLQGGFWIGAGSIVALFISILTELNLPEQTKEESYLDSLPPDHPDRVIAGAYRVCPNCGAFNAPQSKRCHHCGIMLTPL